MASTTKAARPNLFALAVDKSVSAPKKKKKGTALQLPKDLDASGQLQGESRALNEAVTIAIEAKRAMDAAKGRLGAAMGVLNSYAEEAWCATYARNGMQPETPVTFLNHKGDSLTYVVQDKCGQNAISDEQEELFALLLGQKVAANLIETKDTYGFNPDVMKQNAGGNNADKDESVQDVIIEIVSGVVMKSAKLTDEQKGDLFTHTSKKHVRKGTLSRLAELCGADVGKIKSFLEAAGSSIVKYCKT